MEYNTKRDKLLFYDYGRNISKMIEYAKNIQDREERNAAARNIVQVMAMVNPSVKDLANYQHKLWDHLMMWSNFELDVDCPYPVERTSTMRFKPRRLQHRNGRLRFRHYGSFLERMVKATAAMKEGPEKDNMIVLLANQMKNVYYDYNQDLPPFDVLDKQLQEMSGGKLSLPDDITLPGISQRLEHSYRATFNYRDVKKKKKK